MESNFIIKGEAIPKGRPRVNSKGWLYTPKRTKDYEELVASSYEGDKLTGALEVNIEVYMAIPKSETKANRLKMATGEIRPTKANGDLDNIVKAILDGLNGIAYEDDRQVVEIEASKYYTDKEPYTYVELCEIKEDRDND